MDLYAGCIRFLKYSRYVLFTRISRYFEHVAFYFLYSSTTIRRTGRRSIYVVIQKTIYLYIQLLIYLTLASSACSCSTHFSPRKTSPLTFQLIISFGQPSSTHYHQHQLLDTPASHPSDPLEYSQGESFKMQFTTFSTLLALSAFPLSTLAQPYNPWELPRLGTHASSGRPGNDPNSTITFTWNDPNTATSASCFASFLPSFGNEMSHPVDYMDCAPSAETKDSFFAFKIDRYMSIGDFSLTLKRGFRDPS